jgi:SNF2 family DNA or RNA helicase
MNFLLANAASIALLDPGLGKTSITLAAFDVVRESEKRSLMLVIAPLRVCYQVWPTEAAQWADFQHLRVGVLHGKDKDEILEQYMDYDILVINPEGLDWLIGKHDKRLLRRIFGGSVLTIDELTRFKNSQGKRFKLMKQVLDLFGRRWGLTGTPAPNSLLDLFGQCYIIDEGRSLGRYVTHYKRDFFRPLDPNGWKWALQPGAEQRIYERIAPLAIRMAATDHLDLPERVDLRHVIELPPKVRALYDQLEDDLFAKYENGQIVAGNAAAASTKCRQICNGALYVDDDIASLVGGKRRSVLTLHELKLDVVEELLENLQGNQLLLGYEFNHDLDALIRRFGKAGKMPYIGAGVSAKAAAEYEREWNAGNIQMLPCHPASAGHGLNLQKSHAHNVGWYGVPWNYEYYDQFIRRILRQGNNSKRVMNHHIIAKDTVDLIALYDKTRKARGQDALFDALKEMRASRD